METFSAWLAICAGNSPVPGEFPTQRPVTRSFDVYSDLRLNKRLSKQSWGWWFETLSRSLWRHRNDIDCTAVASQLAIALEIVAIATVVANGVTCWLYLTLNKCYLYPYLCRYLHLHVISISFLDTETPQVVENHFESTQEHPHSMMKIS